MNSPEMAAPPETLDDDPRITHMMTSRIVGITPDSPLSTALRLMAQAAVRHLPVLDGAGCLGMVNERDLARFLAGGPGSFAARAAVRVYELTWRTEPLPATARRSDVARRMEAEHSDAVLVTEEGHLVGLVTATDLVHSLAGTAPARPHEGDPS